MFHGVCVPAVLLSLLVLTLRVPSGQSCPRSCNCYQTNEVHCTFRSLLSIPAGLPAHTRRINLGFNSISRLNEKSLAGLKKVELLMLHSNDLHHLPDEVFKDMKSLQILKLSYNKLREISSAVTFSGLTSLLRLYLDHNLLQHIHPRALLQLPSLRLLRLQGNKLHQLHPHTLCTLSLLNTYYFSTLRNLDLSNNSLTTLPKDTLATAPHLETLMLQSNPWSCDCRMDWLLSWSLSHPGLMKCPGGPQCPVCATPSPLHGRGLLEQTSLQCASPIAPFPGKDAPMETDLSEIQSSETFREPLGSASLGLSDEQGNSVDLNCNITHSSSSQDIAPPPDLSQYSSSPLPLALSLSIECPVERQSYEKLWRILAYYSETAVRLEREIMLSKAPGLAYRYRQTAETDGYYHTGVKASVKARPHWLLQPAVSIQLNRAQSNGHKVHLIYSTRVAAPPDPTSSSPSQPWVLISTNHTTTALAAVAGSKVELSCPLLSSGNSKVQWILPQGSRLVSPSSSQDGRLQVSASGLLVQKVQLSDAGIYYCVAWAGRDVDVLPLRLAVEESSVPSSGEQVGPPLTGTVGEAVNMSCKASGSPEPRMTWILPDGNVIRWGLAVSGGLTIDSNGSLLLSNPSLRDAGHYRCIAVNQYGSDSFSMQLILTAKQIDIPPLGTSYSSGPQSASGRSTKIRAPLFHEMDEGSADEEEEGERTLISNRKPSLQPAPNRRYPLGNPRRRGPTRETPPKRGGRPVSSTDQRRNRFENRQKIDPQKWADILAKIRQKTTQNNNSQPITTTAATATTTTAKTTTLTVSTGEHVQRGEDGVEGVEEAEDDREKIEAQEGVEETETEGSSVDDAVLQEEGLQPIQPIHTQTQTETDSTKETEIVGGTERSTESQTDRENETETQTQIEIVGPQTDMTPNPVTHKETATSNSPTEANEIIPERGEGDIQGTNLDPSRTRPQIPRQGLFPNLVPNSRPQSPWNSRRRIGQRRRIMNRPRERPLTSAQPFPDPTNPRSKPVTPDTTTSQSNTLLLVSTATSPASLLTQTGHIQTVLNSVALIPDSSTVGTSHSKSASSSQASSFSHTNTYTDRMTHSATIPDTEESTLFNPSAPTHSHNVISETHKPDTHAGTFTHGMQTHTVTQTASGKHVDRPPGKQREELERNSLDVPYESLSSTTQSFIVPSTAAAITQTTIIPTSSMTGHTTTTPTTPVTTTTSAIVTSTIPTTISTVEPSFTYTFSETADITSVTDTTIQFHEIPKASSTIAPKTTTTKTTTRTVTPSASTKALSKLGPSIAQVDERERSTSGSPNQSRPSTDWKNPGANSIPDSHRSRTHWSPSPLLPVTPVATVARSRPRIADPHIRTVSSPAEGIARLDCESQGEPKPSITWTKVATGTVMSVHSRAQRLEVLPNGTLVIQNVQQQDRGTYICSAQSVLGRDRLLTTLEVWTRPPRMQLPSYREYTIHQGGDVLLDCLADGVPSPLLSWVLPDRSVLTSSGPSTNRISMDTNGTLHISVTSPTDRGVYRCVASNTAGAASASVRVHVSSLPPVIQQLRQEHLLLSPGRPVYAHCSARGAPPPTLRWRIPDGTLVRPSQFLHGNLFVLPNGTLHIRKVGPKDSGSYECTASNAVGADKRTVRVEVEGGGVEEVRPEVTRNEVAKAGATEKYRPSSSLNEDRTLNRPTQPEDSFTTQTLPERSSTFIQSSSHPHKPDLLNPSPKINKGVTTSPTLSTNIKKSNASSTVTTNNTKVSLSTNNRGAPSSFPVDKRTSEVLHPSPVSPFTKARIVSTSPFVSVIHYGGILQLHCSVTGNPDPIIIWRTPSRKLVDMHFSFDRRMKVHPNGTLSVQSATEKEAGDYLCIARNKVSDDYRLLRASVATKPAKIDPKQPVNQMVSFGKPLKVDCQASGLPNPAVRWSLPDGTTVNSVLHGEDRGGRARRLTVFDNGTLLVPAVGMREEGEYTCYAENQGGQDMMKVKVKVMMASAPTFTDDRPYHVVKVRQGATAKIPCQASGDPPPRITWFSSANRVIPYSLGSGYYSERVVVVPGGTLEVRTAQKIDTGNYTCWASNSAGERSMMVRLEVEAPTHGWNGQAAGNSWSINNGPSSNPSIRSGHVNNGDIIRHGVTSAITNKSGSNSSYSDNDGRIRNTVPNSGVNSVISASNPALRSENRNAFNRPASGITTQLGSSAISDGVSGSRNIGINVDNVGINRNRPDIRSSSQGAANTHSIVTGDQVERTNTNEVIAGRTSIDANTSRAQNRFSGNTRVFGGVSISMSNNGGGASTLSRSNIPGVPNENMGNRGGLGSNPGTNNFNNKVIGVLMPGKLQAVKGQTVLLPCPSQGYPPPRLFWLLPGNGMLPAPYYGSRLTVHRNGSLELRGVRASDSGTLVCVVKTDREERTMRVELDVSESQVEARTPHRGTALERPVQKTPGLIEVAPSRDLSNSAQSLSSSLGLPVGFNPQSPVIQKPLQTSSSLPAAPHQAAPPQFSGPISEPAVSTRTAPLVSIINGETLRLPCPASHTSGNAHGSLLWTLPSGKVLSRGESDDSGRASIQDDGTLMIQQASVYDRGSYTCRSAAHDSSAVSVITTPVIVIAYPPRITAGPSPVTYTRPGVAVELPCLTIATPRATVTWETPDLTQLRVMGQPRIYGNRYLSPQGSLVIQNPTGRDTGFYRCTAKNVIGVDTKTTYLHVI